MPIENKFVRCAEDDPCRCQAMGGRGGQCSYKATEGSQYCPMHGGHFAAKQAEAKRQRLYNLAKWQDRIGEHANHDQAKSLREEIGILRILLEGVMGLCQDQNDLLMYSNKISDLATKIEKLVSSCHRLEEKTGMLLDKHAALKIATQIVDIIGAYIEDADIMETISQQIAQCIIGAQPEVS
jgi:hypothetical protein